MTYHIDPHCTYYAPCETSEARSTDTGALSEQSVEAILAECRRHCERSGEFRTFTEYAASTLSLALQLQRLLDAEPEFLAKLLDQPQMLARKRALSKTKRHLICLYACCNAPTAGQRKKISKFAKIVRAAHSEGVEPAQAADWLKSNRFSDLLTSEGKAKPSSMFAVKLSRERYPLLAKTFGQRATGSEKEEAIRIFEAAAIQCEELLKTATPTEPETVV